MRILVTFALDAEFAPWRRLRSFEREKRCDVSLYSAQIGDAKVCALLTGMGPDNAQRSVRAALFSGADCCISSGFAGALRKEFRPAQVLVARAVRGPASNAMLKSDTRLVEFAAHAGARPVDRFLSSDAIVRTAAEKARLGFLCDAVDMESFTILNEARAMRIPTLAVRAVSDSAELDLPLDFGKLTDGRGTVSVSRVMGSLMKAPHKLPALVRLGRDSRRAASALAFFLDGFVQLLADAKWAPIEPVNLVVA